MKKTALIPLAIFSIFFISFVVFGPSEKITTVIANIIVGEIKYTENANNTKTVNNTPDNGPDIAQTLSQGTATIPVDTAPTSGNQLSSNQPVSKTVSTSSVLANTSINNLAPNNNDGNEENDEDGEEDQE